jgi:capsular exopolysaccharide synthesis family protein
MSLIFDALQRAEADRSGLGVSALSAVTDVLKLAELNNARELKSAIHLDTPPTRVQAAGHRASLPLEVGLSRLTGVESPGAISDEQSSLFSKVQSLQVSTSPDSHLVCLDACETPAAEQFRFLGVRLQHLSKERPLKKILITSTIPREGKSMVAANVACALASRMQQKVLLVEGDIRRPSLTSMFGLAKLPGLCDLLQSEGSLVTSIYRLSHPTLWMLPAGAATTNPLELLQSGKLPIFLDQLAECFDWIIIDSPPVLPVADTSIWMRLADGILLVTRQGTTKKSQLQRGLEALDQKKLVGALVNGCQRPSHSDYYGSYLRPTDSE